MSFPSSSDIRASGSPMGAHRLAARTEWVGVAIWATLLAACATPGPTGENDCDRMLGGAGFAELERLAVRERVLNQKVVMDHHVCASDPAALAAFEKSVLFRGLHSERTVEGGQCVRVEVEADPNAESAQAESHRICEQSRLAGARYTSWNSLLGGNNLLFVSGRTVSVRAIPPRPAR